MSATTEVAAPAAHQSSLRSDFLWTFLGNGIYAVAQWAIIVLLAKITQPEVVGQYSFAVAVATPVITFACFQMRVVQVTDTRGEHTFSDYLGFRLFSMAAAMIVLSGICVALKYAAPTFALVEVLGLALAVEAVSDAFYGRMQAHNRMDSIAKSMIIRSTIATAVLFGTVFLTASILWGLIASLAVRVAVLIFFDTRTRLTLASIRLRAFEISLRPRWNFRTQKLLLETTLPIGLVAVLVALNTSIPRYFIEWSTGPRELGIFAALSFFPSSGNMIVQALGQAAFNRLATNYARPDREGFFPLLSKLVLMGAGLGVAGIAGAFIAGKQILTLMYRPEYAARADLLVSLMFAAGLGFCCQFIGIAVTSARIFKPQVGLFFVVAATLTMSCYLLVPGHGAAGAITAVVIATVVQIAGFLLLLLLHFRSLRNKRQPETLVGAVDELVVS